MLSHKRMSLDALDVTPAEMADIFRENPSLYAMLKGYVGERKLRDFLFEHEDVDACEKMDDHNREHKYDLQVRYRGQHFKVESKGIQTNTIRRTGLPSVHWGAWQYNTSNRRQIRVGGVRLDTSSIPFGMCDVVAVPLWDFHGRWEFAFVLNRDLKPSNSQSSPHEVRHLLVATSQRIRYPLVEPYRSEPFSLFDELFAGKCAEAKHTVLGFFGKEAKA